jgi:hypothetical protein
LVGWHWFNTRCPKNLKIFQNINYYEQFIVSKGQSLKFSIFLRKYKKRHHIYKDSTSSHLRFHTMVLTVQPKIKNPKGKKRQHKNKVRIHLKNLIQFKPNSIAIRHPDLHSVICSFLFTLFRIKLVLIP